MLFLLFFLILVSIYFGRRHIVIDNEERLIENRERDRLALIQQVARSDIDGFISDALLLAKGEILFRYLNSRKQYVDRVYVEKEFVTMSRERAVYDEIGYIGSDGQERIRVNYNNGNPAIVPKHLLQNRSNRYYFKDSIKLEHGEVYISPLDLNMQNGKIEIPTKPMIRVGTTVVDGYGKRKGVLILNYYGERILSKIGRILSKSAGESNMFNNEGFSLLGPRKDGMLGFMLGKNATLKHQQPTVWNEIQKGHTGTVKNSHDTYLYVTIPLAYGGDLDSMQQNYWKLVIRLTPEKLFSADSVVRSHLLIIVAVSFLVSFFVGYLLHQLKETQSQLALVKRLKEAQSRLVQSEKMASLGRMVAGFAHEINTPIGIAVGSASHGSDAVKQLFRLLERDEVLEEDLEDGLATIGEAADLALSNLRRAAALITSFKHMSVDQSSEKPRNFSFQELIQDVINSLHNTFKRTRIEFVIECPEHLRLDGIPGIYTQILTNLIMNSYIHGFANGAEAGNIGVRVRESSDSQLILEYWDTGMGMDEETQDRIFEPFFTTNRGDGGSGLGLYICYNLVSTQLAGNITLSSTPGNGTHFLIEHGI